MGVAAASAVPEPTDDSLVGDDDYGYGSDDYQSGDDDPENTPGPAGGDATGGGKGDDDFNDQEMALLDGKSAEKKPDLKISAVDSSQGTPMPIEEEAKEEPTTKALKGDDARPSDAGKKMARHKSTGMLRKEKLSYRLQPDMLPGDLKKTVAGLTVKESFEVMKLVLSKNDQLFDHLKQFQIRNVQKQAKMQVFNPLGDCDLT